MNKIKQFGNGEKLNGFEIAIAVLEFVGVIAGVGSMILNVKNPRNKETNN